MLAHTLSQRGPPEGLQTEAPEGLKPARMPEDNASEGPKP